ncbi:MAG: PDC sensor domain-containing protein [Proteobacteria bacterium]|nr:PDC sensor domain-containing protein [Pseudomonadota bacterium]
MGIGSVAVCLMLNVGLAAEKAPQKIYDLANKTLAQLGSDPVIVEAVKAENAKGKTLAAVKAMDDKWRATPGIADNMKAIMESPCGKRLREIQASASYYAEIFVMDDKGANVAMTDKTSDYWQGDEAKFKNAYSDGKGAVFVDDVEFDDSSQAYLVQVSVPVKDGETVIGAITFGIDVDKVE